MIVLIFSFSLPLPLSLSFLFWSFLLLFDRCRHTKPWGQCVCFESVLYEEIVWQHPAPLEVSAGKSCTVFTPFISLNFFLYLTIKLISSYSGFWNLFTPQRKENNIVFLWLEGGPFPDFPLHRASDGTRSGASKSGRQHKIGNNNSETTNHNALSMAGESN